VFQVGTGVHHDGRDGPLRVHRAAILAGVSGLTLALAANAKAALRALSGALCLDVAALAEPFGVAVAAAMEAFTMARAA
jgi:hypothetical protein